MGEHRGNPDEITEAYYRGLMHAVGHRRSDLDKPQIAVVNSWTEVNPGHQPLKELGDMHYILPQRDLIAASIKAMVRAHGFEGMVMLASCDKIIPGMLMAAERLNLPTIFLTGGAMLPCRIDDRTVVTSDLKESIGQRRNEEIDHEIFLDWQECFSASPGTCSMMGTANTMRINGLRHPKQSAAMPNGKRMMACHKPYCARITPTNAAVLRAGKIGRVPVVR